MKAAKSDPSSSMRRIAPRLPAVFVACVAFGAGWISLDYPVGTVLRPGPGFFPLGLVIALAAMSAILLFRTERSGCDSTITFREVRAAVGVLGAIVVFGMAIEPLGLTTAIVLMVILAVFARVGSAIRDGIVLATFLACLGAGIFVFALGLPIDLGWW